MTPPKRIAINGFGRIGRCFFRAAFNNPNLKLVAINDAANVETLAHLLKYDSIHRRFPAEVSFHQNFITAGNITVQVFSELDPQNLPWEALGIDIVIESTGKFLTQESAGKHLKAGAKKVIISAPAKDNEIKTIVIGVNDDIMSSTDTIISNASCTTNNAAPMLMLLDEAFEVENAYITTVHSYTGDQRLHDSPHSDLRRARAAAVSIIPTSTGAAKAVGKVFPHLEGKLGGCGMRVPVPNGSLSDISCIVKKSTTIAEVNQLFKTASQTRLKGILEYTEDPIVSIDIIGNPSSCIFDSGLTSVLGRMVKVVGWYDNEWGYSNRLVELAIR
jgi:glyceraldehyde 3-phosphate dehydrogenase